MTRRHFSDSAVRPGWPIALSTVRTAAELALDAVRYVFDGRPVTPDVAASLNPDLDWAELCEVVVEIGWAVAGGYLPRNGIPSGPSLVANRARA